MSLHKPEKRLAVLEDILLKERSYRVVAREHKVARGSIETWVREHRSGEMTMEKLRAAGVQPEALPSPPIKKCEVCRIRSGNATACEWVGQYETTERVHLFLTEAMRAADLAAENLRAAVSIIGLDEGMRAAADALTAAADTRSTLYKLAKVVEMHGVDP